MPAARYWRATALEAYGAGDLELSCFHLLDAAGVRVDAPATLTANSAPSTGAVANLQDDDLTTAVRWPVQSIASLALTWDFGGSPVDVGYAQMAGDSEVRFVLIAKLQYSNDAVTWVTLDTYWGVTWPGVKIKTARDTSTGKWSRFDKGADVSVSAAGNVLQARSTSSARAIAGKSAGKLQFEISVGAIGSAASAIGVFTPSSTPLSSPGGYAGAFVYRSNAAKLFEGVSTAYGASWAAGDVIGCVVDFSVGSLTFYKNGVSQGIASATGMLGLTLHPAAGEAGSSTAYSTYTLRGENFIYPVSGASPWLGTPYPPANAASRAVALDLIAISTGPAITYGIPQITEPVNFTIQSGAIKDYASGVLGTGRGRVAGTVKEKGTPDAPVYRKVRLIREADGLQMREVWSHPTTGAYSFDFIDELQKFTVLSYDHTGAFRAVVASGITPELIP